MVITFEPLVLEKNRLSTPDFSHYPDHIQYLTLRLLISVVPILKSTIFMLLFFSLLL